MKLIKTIFLHVKKLNWIEKICFSFFIFIFFIGFFAPVISNSKPIYLKLNGKSEFPVFSDNNLVPTPNDYKSWNSLNPELILFPPVPYTYFEFNIPESKLKPLSHNHLLGTNLMGRDIFSGIIYGARNSILIGIVSAFISLIIGVTLGYYSGYMGNSELKMPWIEIIILILLSPFVLFYSITICFKLSIFEHWFISILMFIALSFLIFFLLHKFFFIMFKNYQSITIPVDDILSRMMEIFIGIPKIIIIITMSVVFEKSFWNLVFIIGLSSWVTLARLIRVEVMKFKQMDFILNAKSLGFSNIRVFFKHILPNILPIILVTFIFNISNAILIESSLTFLNLGLPSDEISWGVLIQDGRDHLKEWWIITFPLITIILTLFSLNVIGESFKLKRNEI